MPEAAVSTPALLELSGISKSFPGLRALDDVRLAVGAGEIVAVVGANGSGKSTLVKILAGIHEPDPGASMAIRREGVAARAGDEDLHFIHQDLGLIATLTTVENLDLGRRHRAGGLLPVASRSEADRARRILGDFGVDVDVTLPLSELSPAERTIVAIARALHGWTRPDNVLVLDEPTAALHGEEVDRLFEAIRRLAARGAGIIFISHRLDEVTGLADRVVALRDGRVVADVPVADIDHDGLVQLIAGRELSGERPVRAAATDAPMLDVTGLAGGTVAEMDVALRPGEVVGVTGLLGSGREHVAGLLFGAQRRTGGHVRVGGAPVPAGDPCAAIALGMAFVPADRRGAGAVMTLSARENLTLPRLSPLRRAFGRIDRAAERREVDHWVRSVDLRPADAERRLDQYSGGNQQKIVLAKWLRNEPVVLLLDEPTQGIDIGAKDGIYALIDAASTRGAAVLICSSDTKELAAVCDRVVVMREGRPASEVARVELSEERLVRESLGITGGGS
jgi:ABC-type sugar transport system ATPase subunit